MRSTKVNPGDQGLATQYNNLLADAYGASMLLAHQQASPGLTLYVEPGVFYIGATRVIFAGGNSPSFSAPAASNKRIDILTINSAGTLAITQGTPTTGSPSAPAYPTDGTIVIAEVYNRAGQSSIKDANETTNGYIYNDVRPFLWQEQIMCGTTGGSANAYTLTLTPAITTYITGKTYKFIASFANTGAATLAINGLSAVSLVKQYNVPLTTGDILSGQAVEVIYDGTNFQIVGTNGFASTMSFTAAEAISAGNPVAIGPYQSDGGIKFDTKGHGQDGFTGATTGTKTFTNALTIGYGGGNNTLIVHVVMKKSSNGPSPDTITGVNWNGVALTKVLETAGSFGSSDNNKIYTYYLQNAAQGTHDLSFAWQNSYGSGVYAGGLYYVAYNYYQTAGVDDYQLASGGGGGTTFTNVTLGGQYAGQLINSCFCNCDKKSGAACNANNNTDSWGLGTAGDSGISGYAMPVTIQGQGQTSGYADVVLTVALRPATIPSNYIYQAGSASPAPNSCQFNRYQAFIGFAPAGISALVPGIVQMVGVATGLSGLIPAMQYYLNDTAGTIGVAIGTNSRKVGIAITTTLILITNIF